MTNMPKWNLYFAFANNGNLVNKSGNTLVNTAGAYMHLGAAADATLTNPGQVWLKAPLVNQVKGTDGKLGAPQTMDVTSVTLGTAAADGVISTLKPTFTAMLKGGTTAACGAACEDNGWVYGTDATTATFDVGTYISNTALPGGLAGTYTETLYITLVTAY
jgi:hypothetical protein